MDRGFSIVYRRKEMIIIRLIIVNLLLVKYIYA